MAMIVVTSSTGGGMRKMKIVEMKCDSTADEI